MAKRTVVVAVLLMAGGGSCWEPSIARAQKLEIGQTLRRPELPTLSPCPGAGLVQTFTLPSGAEGFWFPSDAARCTLGRLELLPELLVYVGLLEERQTLTDARERLLRQETELAAAEADEATGALEAAERGRRQAEEDRDAWHRSRLLWAIVGGITVVVIEAIAIYTLNRLEP